MLSKYGVCATLDGLAYTVTFAVTLTVEMAHVVSRTRSGRASVIGVMGGRTAMKVGGCSQRMDK